MQKTLTHGGIKYDTRLLVSIKGQGTNVRITSSECVSNSSTIVSSEIKKPILVNHEGTLLILVDVAETRGNGSFDAVLLSKHILKKARVVQEQSPTVDSFAGKTPAQRALAVLSERMNKEGRAEHSGRQERTYVSENSR